MLTKTLKFGLAEVHGTNKEGTEFVQLSGEQREKIYGTMKMEACRTARIFNHMVSEVFATKILKITPQEEEQGEMARDEAGKGKVKKLRYNLSYPRTLDQMEGKSVSSAEVLSQVKADANDQFSGKRWESIFRTGEQSIPTRKPNTGNPLVLTNLGIKLRRIEGLYCIVAHLLESKWSKEEGLPSWLAFPIVRKPGKDHSLIAQFDKILEGEWKSGSGFIQRSRKTNTKKPKWNGGLSVRFEPVAEKELDPLTIMGMDLGVAIPVVLHFRPHGKKEFPWTLAIGKSVDILRERSKVKRQIIGLARRIKSKLSSASASEQDLLKERRQKLRKKERNVIKTVNQRIAKKIRDEAMRQNAGMWRIEDITGEIKEEKPFFARNWAVAALMDAIEWQAKQVGAQIVRVNPRYTSQICSSCLKHSPDSRYTSGRKSKMGREFICKHCNYKEDADRNAARNISNPEIEEIAARIVKEKHD